MIEQVDRDAAADLRIGLYAYEDADARMIRAGEADNHTEPRRFAAHRIAAEQAMVAKIVAVLSSDPLQGVRNVAAYIKQEFGA